MKYEEQYRLVNFSVKFLRGTEELNTVVLIHGNGQETVDDDEDDNKELEDVKVKSPELPASRVLSPQYALEDEQNAYDSKQ